MRVLVLPSWYPPEGGSFFRDQSEALMHTGLEVHVLVNENRSLKRFHFQDYKKGKQLRVYNENGLTVVRKTYWKLPKNEQLNVKYWTAATFDLFKKYINKFGRPDILLVYSSLWAGLVAAQIYREFQIPYVINEHRGRFVAGNRYSGKYIEKWYIPFLREALQYSVKVVAVSPALEKKLIELEPSVAQKIYHIPDSIDTIFFHPSVQKQNREFIFFALGDLIFLKGYDILLKAFAKLVSQNHNSFRLIIGGEGKEKKYLQKFAVGLKIGDKVTFTGKLDRQQVLQYLQMANVFVHPSRLESFGVVLIEAMACGLPLIATRCGGPEYIVTPETGLLVEPDNPGKLSDAMSYFVQNYNNYNRDGIRKFAMEHFNQHDVALQYLSLFKQLDLGQI